MKKVTVFEIDAESEIPHAAACIQTICDGQFKNPKSILPGEMREREPPEFFVPRPDYVLMGTHGKTFLERFVVSSVAANVLHNVDVPCIFYCHEEEKKATRNVVLIGLEGTGSSIEVVKFYLRKLARKTDDCILAHVPMREQTMRQEYVTQGDVTLNLEMCTKLVEAYVKENDCSSTFRLRDISVATKNQATTPTRLDPREQLVQAAKGFGATLLLVGRSAFGDQNFLGKAFYVGTLPLYCTQYSSSPVAVYSPPRGSHAPKSYQRFVH